MSTNHEHGDVWMSDWRKLGNEALLDLLDAERRKFTKSDESLMRAMIDELASRNIYPAIPKANPNDVHAMVSGWGARWHIWRPPLTCPRCGADWRDRSAGPPFKREIAIVGSDDNLAAVECPDCHALYYGTGRR